MLVSPRVARMVGNTQMAPQYTDSLTPDEGKNIDAKTAALNQSLEQDLAHSKIKVSLLQQKQTSLKNDQSLIQKLQRQTTSKAKSSR